MKKIPSKKVTYLGLVGRLLYLLWWLVSSIIAYVHIRSRYYTCQPCVFESLIVRYVNPIFPPLGKLTSKCQELVNRATTRLAVAIGREDRCSSQR